MSIAAITTGRRPRRIAQLARRLRAAAGRISDAAHAAGDDRAQASGWTITRTAGPLGLAGRAYRDPRFDTRGRP